MEKISNFINGKSVSSSSGEKTKIVDPSTGQAYAEAPKSNQADVDAAMKAAASAFASCMFGSIIPFNLAVMF